MKKIIAASILSADFTRLAEEIRAVEDAGADWLHVDVMDGHFVPNLTIGPPVIEKIKKVAKVPLDVHLMITNAEETFQDYVNAGADFLTIHVEACKNISKTLQKIRGLGVKASVTLNPDTPLKSILPTLSFVDMVLIMSVNPGFGGQSFISSSLDKAKKLAEIRKQKKLSFLIEMDGGIKTDNIAEVSKSGVDVFVVGSGIFKTPDYRKTIKSLKEKIRL